MDPRAATRFANFFIRFLVLTAIAAFPLYAPAAQARLSDKESLGQSLFFDRNLSEPAGQSCASCHAPRAKFADPNKRFPTSKGADPTLFGSRNTPSVAYAAFSPPFHFDEEEGAYQGGVFRDGRAGSLEDQAKGPLLNPVEMANASKRSVVEKVRYSRYAPLFKSVFGQQIFRDTDLAYDKIAEAIAAFERTKKLNRFSSKFDASVNGKARLTAQEERGRILFEDPAKANCAACHYIKPEDGQTDALFTDFSFDNLGVPKNPNNRFYQMPEEYNPDGFSFIDLGLGGVLNLADQNGKQKVPTLRNIAVTGPYMHNGYFNTLRGVVEFYNTRDVKPACPNPLTTEKQALAQGCWPEPEVKENVNRDELGNLGLSSQDVDDIVAFLRTLTDRPSRTR